jgi:hypothetical protein
MNDLYFELQTPGVNPTAQVSDLLPRSDSREAPTGGRQSSDVTDEVHRRIVASTE